MLQGNFQMLFAEAAFNRFFSALEAYVGQDDAEFGGARPDGPLEVLGKNKYGDIIPLEISVAKSNALSQAIVTCIIRDIAQRKTTERKLKFLAYHDKLTQLGNRDLFNNTLNEYLEEVIRYKDRIGALLFLDLDGFKKVNDTLGHDIGDRILVECSRRLRDCLRKSDHIYRADEDEAGARSKEDLFRFGGDEFILLLSRLRDQAAAATVARKVIQTVGQPYNIEGVESIRNVKLGVSVGIAVIPDDGLEATVLVSRADVAMYKAKEKRNTFAFFKKDMNNQAAEKLMLEDRLRQAFGKGQLQLYYQPLVSRDGTIQGAEALLRWQDESGQFISPGKFIPIAEETGLILPMGDWILNAACDFLRSCNNDGHPDFYVSVNLSARQFDQHHLVERITSTVNRTRVKPANITIEVTESYIMSDPEGSIEKMLSMKENNPGIRIAIDDFGTGYSSLGYLSTFPVDILKIDQSFIAELSDRSNAKIVNTIIGLAHSLNLKTVAEGVETVEHLELLASKDCDLYQGYYFGAPSPMEQMVGFLKRGTLPA
jgi:diguanylate cyclase (GGDEF)-like protein